MIYELANASMYDHWHYGRPYARNQNQEPGMEYEIIYFFE